MVKKRSPRLPAPPFDPDEFEREANATLAGMTDAEIASWHERLASGANIEQLKQADEIARRFFKEMKNGRQLSRPIRPRRRASTT